MRILLFVFVTFCEYALRLPLLNAHNIRVISLELNAQGQIPVMIDGSQEIGRKGRTSLARTPEDSDDDLPNGDVCPCILCKDKVWLTAADTGANKASPGRLRTGWEALALQAFPTQSFDPVLARFSDPYANRFCW